MLDHSQLSAAKHANAEQIALEAETLATERGRAIGDDMREEIDSRLSPAELSSSVFSTGPPPGFDSLGSGASMAPPVGTDERECMPTPVPVTGVPTAAMAVKISASPERATVGTGAAQQFTGNSCSGGNSGSNAANSVVSATPKRASVRVAAPAFWRALSGIIVILCFAGVLALGFTTMIGDEVRCMMAVYS